MKVKNKDKTQVAGFHDRSSRNTEEMKKWRAYMKDKYGGSWPDAKNSR